MPCHTSMVIAYRSGIEDRRVGSDPKPWPWDDGGPLESAYLTGYNPAAELRRRVLAAVSDVRLVFDPKLWGGRDHPKGNERFMKAADILKISMTEHGEEIATVRFHHDGRISRGHFTTGMI